ncbi:MAG: glutathione S-transferase C-terminal domain-containing protein, partial [Pseudomonadota bacterium]
DFLGNKTFMMGHEPSGLDATAFAFLAGALCPLFETPLRTAVERHDNIKAYVSRMAERYYPDLAEFNLWAA